MEPSVGGGQLRGLREERSLTQTDLARTSRVSERAIRSIESGETRRPHPATLRSLAKALNLTEAQARKFARSFVAPVVADLSDVLGVSPLVLQDQLRGLHESAHAANWTSDVYHCHQTVRDDKRFGLNRVHRVIRSNIEALTHVMCSVAYDDEVDALSPVTDAFGVAVSQHWVLPDHQLTVVEFTLPRPLGVGQSHAYGYSIDDGASTSPGLVNNVANDIIEGSRGPVGTFVLETQFEGSPPSLITPFTVFGTHGERQRADPVRPDQTGTVRMQVHNTAPGQALGFEWQW
ncbi:MAG: helix-turn-helix domain-containing protein [Propionibacteriales bacterium]|nr:helix-turn-helix domain-containing protein [Propionibacteriales bacterium]